MAIQSQRDRGASSDRWVVLAAAVAIDLLLGEPPASLHPVAWIGSAIDGLEEVGSGRDHAESLRFGFTVAIGLPLLCGLVAHGVERSARLLPRPARLLLLALALKPSFALRGLLQAGAAVAHALQDDDLPRARTRLTSLVSRDTAALWSDECAAAAIESLAENATDSFVGPWLGYVLFGLPGAWVFRTANTLDSRWGYRGRYEQLGRAAAILDDVLACLPTRLSAILLIAASPIMGASAAGALRMALRDRTNTASPNAGWTMSAMAGALGVRLSKPGHYILNDGGRTSTAADVQRARRLIAALSGVAIALALISTYRTSRGHG